MAFFPSFAIEEIGAESESDPPVRLAIDSVGVAHSAEITRPKHHVASLKANCSNNINAQPGSAAAAASIALTLELGNTKQRELTHQERIAAPYRPGTKHLNELRVTSIAVDNESEPAATHDISEHAAIANSATELAEKLAFFELDLKPSPQRQRLANS